jgi:hypothetical protein
LLAGKCLQVLIFKPQAEAKCIFNLILSELGQSYLESPRTSENLLSNRIYQNQDKKMAEEAKTEAAKPAPMIFKGVCSDGVLKGKEIQGKLDIKVNVESVTTPPAPKKAAPGWEKNIFWVLFLLVANLVLGDPAGIRKYSSPQRSHSHQMLNQSGERSLLPKKNTSNSPL